MNKETFTGKVEIFPDGWFFVRVPTKKSDPFLEFREIGNVKITAAINNSTWNTMLWAFGDSKFFITLPAKIRKKEKINEGDNVKVSFGLRNE